MRSNAAQGFDNKAEQNQQRNDDQGFAFTGCQPGEQRRALPWEEIMCFFGVHLN